MLQSFLMSLLLIFDILLARCLLVSRPLGDRIPKNGPWTTIGMGRPIPSLLDTIPIYEHWALCVERQAASTENIELSDPGSRQLFLDATYIELDIVSSDSNCCKAFSSKGSYGPVTGYENKWDGDAVRSITAVQEIGTTSKTDHWLLARGTKSRDNDKLLVPA
jgi:hypothetical protein